MQPTLVRKSSGELEKFDTEKLRQSLINSGASVEIADRVLTHILEEIRNNVPTSQIHSHATFLLHKFQKPSAVRYSLKKAIMDLGPTGFPFEDYVAEILKSRGFNTHTRQILTGHCVTHEVDVVAHNDKKLILAEVKFHNEPGVRSDVKVALYVKARFDDLRGIPFDYGLKRPFDEGWLITNTKFTSTALDYGMCNQINMISWNFPKHGNLRELIEDGNLHPVTCLRTLSLASARELIAQGIVLCKQLKDNPYPLNTIGLNQTDISLILEEINSL
jgi:hypothetical protein